MTKSDPRRNQEIGWIKARQKAAGMPDDDYRAMLAAQTGKTSAAVLTWQERKKVLAYMERHYPMTKPKRAQQPGQTHKALAGAKEPIERKIGYLLGQLGADWPYAYAIGRRIYPEVEKF